MHWAFKHDNDKSFCERVEKTENYLFKIVKDPDLLITETCKELVLPILPLACIVPVLAFRVSFFNWLLMAAEMLRLVLAS